MTAKVFILIGLTLLIVGILLHYFPSLFAWFGKLPGDIHIQKNNISIHFPLMTSILASALLSILFYFFKK